MAGLQDRRPKPPGELDRRLLAHVAVVLANGTQQGFRDRPVLRHRSPMRTGHRELHETLHAANGLMPYQLQANVCAQRADNGFPEERKSVEEGKSVSVRVDLWGRRIPKKKKTKK